MAPLVAERLLGTWMHSSSATSRLAFAKHDRLLRRFEFLRAQSKGRRVQTPHFTLLLFDRADGTPTRLGITASRRAANSVGRNRIRRVVREVFRLHREAFPPCHDCVVIVRESVPHLAFVAVRDEILHALARPARDRSARRP